MLGASIDIRQSKRTLRLAESEAPIERIGHFMAVAAAFLRGGHVPAPLDVRCGTIDEGHRDLEGDKKPGGARRRPVTTVTVSQAPD